MTNVTDEMVEAFARRAVVFEEITDIDITVGLQALFDAKLISLPVDEAAIRESVVREAIAMFEYSDRYHYTGKAVCENLRSILTPKDRAEALHEQFMEEHPTCPGDWGWREHSLAFGRWLIERGGV